MKLLLFSALAWAGVGLGWRGDGSGVAGSAMPPAAWATAPHIAWSTPMPSTTNATPVVAGDVVCTLSEPVMVVCLDRRDGSERWRATHPVVDALEGHPEADAIRAAVSAAEKAQGALMEVKRRYGELQRRVRAEPTAERAAELQSVSQELARLQGTMAAAERYRARGDLGLIGWTSATPTTDGERLWVLFGNGVLAAHDASTGQLLWRRWLGLPTEPMRGYHQGHASSPRWVDGRLLVPLGHLHGIDAATGESLWTHDAPWNHYGTPAVWAEGSGYRAATPGGEVLDVATGAVIQTGLPEQNYLGPVVDGSQLVIAVGVSRSDARSQGGVDVVAWDRASGGERWRTRVPTKRSLYADPVVSGGRVYVVDDGGAGWVLGAADGEIRGAFDPTGDTRQAVFASPVIAGDRLHVAFESGRIAVLSLADAPAVQAELTLEPTRSAPLFEGDTVYIRTSTRLLAIRSPSS